MRETIRDIIIEALSEAYVNDKIYGVKADCFESADDVYCEISQYLGESELPLETIEEKCRVILLDIVKNIARVAFKDGLSVYEMFNEKDE